MELKESYSFPWADIKKAEWTMQWVTFIYQYYVTKYPLLHYSFVQQIILSAY